MQLLTDISQVKYFTCLMSHCVILCELKGNQVIALIRKHSSLLAALIHIFYALMHLFVSQKN